ncbi:DUF452 family protein [Chlorobium sp. KB01]|uniref:DUF452 family protein n=1 Tax=Chlorobium sp. KB01 TaxID=1917528 RepID=UPI000977D1AD|nr:pimeloyl-ACP methyl esterase BioG family protein [Chlorobium sp. KB01]
MKTEWLRKEGSDELLLFFNGWGMDGRIARHLLDVSLREGVDEDFNADLLACYDYRNLEPEAEFMDDVSRYTEITVIAWSFGVWAAQQIMLPPIQRALALNGTLYPVDERKGIPPGVFQATLASYSEENRNRFNRRMCGSSEAFVCFSAMASARDTAEQKEELERLNSHVQSRSQPSTPEWQYSHAIIGGRDLVFPAEQQYAAWRGVPQTIIGDMAHFPFFHFSTLQELLACFRK